MIRLFIIFLWGCTPCAAGKVCVIVGNGTAGFNGDGLTGPDTSLYLPSDVFQLPDKTLGFADFNNYRIRHLTSEGRVETIAGNGEHAYAIPNAKLLDSPLENPNAASLGPDGFLYVAVQHEGRILRLTDRIEVVAGTGILGNSGDGGPAELAELQDPTGLAFDSNQHLYISDASANRIRWIHEGQIDTAVGGGSEMDGVGPKVALDNPQHLSWHRDRLWIPDSGNNRIITFDPATSLVEEISGGTGYLDGPVEMATWSSPAAIAFSERAIYIADSRNHAIRRIQDGEVSTVLGTGYAGLPIENSEAADTVELNFPTALWWDPNRGLYIVNQLAHQIVLWIPDEP